MMHKNLSICLAYITLVICLMTEQEDGAVWHNGPLRPEVDNSPLHTLVNLKKNR